jgi:alginate O-acetyltransferase complex protein AlgJ
MTPVKPMVNLRDRLSKQGRSLFDRIVALVFCCTMILGLGQIFYAAHQVELEPKLKTREAFLNGSLSKEIEKGLNAHLPSRSVLIAVSNAIRFVLFGSGGELVVVGKDDWLFLKEELNVRVEQIGFDKADWRGYARQRLQIIEDVSHLFRSKGIELVVGIVPDKSRVYASKLPQGNYPSQTSQSYDFLINGLRQRKINVVNLYADLVTAALEKDVFYKTDSHWNQAGARAAADSISKSIKQLHLKIDDCNFRTSTQGAPVEYAGDLMRLVGMHKAPKWLGLPRDVELSIQTEESNCKTPTDLFSQAHVSVTLVGTSFSFASNFHGFLQEALSARVLNASKVGGGMIGSMSSYLSNDAFLSSPAKVVIWEIPERIFRTKLVAEITWTPVLKSLLDESILK